MAAQTFAINQAAFSPSETSGKALKASLGMGRPRRGGGGGGEETAPCWWCCFCQGLHRRGPGMDQPLSSPVNLPFPFFPASVLQTQQGAPQPSFTPYRRGARGGTHSCFSEEAGSFDFGLKGRVDRMELCTRVGSVYLPFFRGSGGRHYNLLHLRDISLCIFCFALHSSITFHLIYNHPHCPAISHLSGNVKWGGGHVDSRAGR